MYTESSKVGRLIGYDIQILSLGSVYSLFCNFSTCNTFADCVLRLLIQSCTNMSLFVFEWRDIFLIIIVLHISTERTNPVSKAN